MEKKVQGINTPLTNLAAKLGLMQEDMDKHGQEQWRKGALITLAVSICVVIAIIIGGWWWYNQQPEQKLVNVSPESLELASQLEKIISAKVEESTPPPPQLWEDLPKEEKNKHVATAFILFPELFSKKYKTKYKRFNQWLLDKHNIVHSNARNTFTAGGRGTIKIAGEDVNIPSIFRFFNKHQSSIFYKLKNIDKNTLDEYWEYNTPVTYQKRFEYLKNEIIKQSKKTISSRPFNVEALFDKYFSQINLALSNHKKTP